MKKILVTGGLGFIGSHACVELIQSNYEIIIADDLSNSRIQVLDGIEKITGVRPIFKKINLTKQDETRQLFADHSIESILHFAAKKAVDESVKNPLLYYRNNIVPLLNLLEFSKNYAIKNIIFSSSCTVYGEPDMLPVTENTPTKKATSPYGNTKQIGEEIIDDFVKTNQKTKAISLRYFNPIGAHKSALIGELPLGTPNNLVPFITQTAIGLQKKLLVFSSDYDTPDGTCIRDYVHVVDLAKAHVTALKYCDSMKNGHEIFNIGTGKGASVLDVIRSLEKTSGQTLNYKIVGRRPGDVAKTYADASKANKILKWKAERDLDDMTLSAWKWQLALPH